MYIAIVVMITTTLFSSGVRMETATTAELPAQATYDECHEAARVYLLSQIERGNLWERADVDCQRAV